MVRSKNIFKCELQKSSNSLVILNNGGMYDNWARAGRDVRLIINPTPSVIFGYILKSPFWGDGLDTYCR